MDGDEMVPLPYRVDGVDNDLNEKIDSYIKRAKSQDAVLYVFGDRWVGIFLAFQSQSWHTDDRDGHALDADVRSRAPEVPEEEAEEAPVLIVGARVIGREESVTLLNVTNQTIDLTGWALANRAKQKYSLTGGIKPGEFLTIGFFSQGLTKSEPFRDRELFGRRRSVTISVRIPEKSTCHNPCRHDNIVSVPRGYCLVNGILHAEVAQG